MSDFDQTCSQDEASAAAPQVCEVDAYTAPEPEPQAGPDPSYAAPDPSYAAPTSGASNAPQQSQQDTYGVFDHYADEPVSAVDANGAGGAGGAPVVNKGPVDDAPVNERSEEQSEAQPDDGGQCVDPGPEQNQFVDPDEGGQCVDPGPDKTEDKSADDKSADPDAKKPEEMTDQEKEDAKNEKLKQYANQSDEEKQARWAMQDGKLPKEKWDEIKDLPTAERNQKMLQAGIDKLDPDDPRRAELEKIQSDMQGKNSRTGGAYATGTPQTGCGGTADEMLRKGGDPSKGSFPGYFYGGHRQQPANDGQQMTPKSGDVYELQDNATPGSTQPGDIHGHAGTFCVASPDGTTWLTYDGGQQDKSSDKQEIKLVSRNVSVDNQGRTIVGAPDAASGSEKDMSKRAVSGTYDYQKMYNKYPSLREPE